MTPTLISHFCRLVSEHRLGAHLVLLFDYDGTLAPFAANPSLGILPHHARTALERLSSLSRVHLGIISGRELADLKAMVALPGLLLGGTTGLEIDFRGVVVRHPHVGKALPDLRLLAECLGESLQRYPGAWLESKRSALTVHYRAVARHQHTKLKALVSQYVEQCSHSFVIHEGAAAFEIIPRLGWNKGTAVRMFLDSIPARRSIVFYAGDSSNDSDAMAVALQKGGVTIGVGRSAPRIATHTVPHPEVLTMFLSELAKALVASPIGRTRRSRMRLLGSVRHPESV